jgi:O-antigen/teichoic acid export membrane protein
MTATTTSSRRRMGWNLGYSTVSAGSAVLLLALSVLISRQLGEQAWGDFSFALALSMIGEALMDFGVHQVTIRSIAREPGRARELFQNSLALKILPGVAMFVALTVVAVWLHPERELRIASALMVGSAIFRSYLLTVRGVLQGLERFANDTLIVVGDRILVLVFSVIAVWFGAGLIGVAAAFLIARAVAVVGALVIARQHVGSLRPAFDRAIWTDLRQRALPLGAFLTVLNLYSYIDTLILRSLTDAAETGIYNWAYKAYEGLTYAPAIISAVVTPRLSHLWSSDRTGHARLVRNSLAASGGLAMAATAATWVLAPIVLPLIFGSEAVAAVLALRILALGLIFVFGLWILQAIAISIVEERWLLRTTVIGCIVNVGLNFYLIPRYGRNGAAAATVLSECLSMGILATALRQAIWPPPEAK